jgi:hypothetical protein
MKYKKITKIEAVVLTLLLVGAMFLIPAGSVEIHEEKFSASEHHESIYGDSYDEEQNLGPFILDRKYIIEDSQPATLDDDSNDDAGSKRDAGYKISRSSAIYIGEPIDNTPGRGRTGKLSSSDDEDWYFFSVCEGQNILITMSPPSGYDFNLALWDKNESERDTSEKPGAASEAISFTADYTGYWYMLVEYVSGPDEGQYSFDVTLNGQNDADTGNDAGDSFSDATSLSSGQYSGYLDMNDGQDWYKFQANAGNSKQMLAMAFISL